MVSRAKIYVAGRHLGRQRHGAANRGASPSVKLIAMILFLNGSLSHSHISTETPETSRAYQQIAAQERPSSLCIRAPLPLGERLGEGVMQETISGLTPSPNLSPKGGEEHEA
jgi:hypothetical protein